MTERFIAMLGNKYHRIEDNETNSVYYSEDAQSIDWLVGLLNKLHQENIDLDDENARLLSERIKDLEQFEECVNKAKELKEENEQLRHELKQKQEEEQLYANEILELREANKEFIQFKSLGGDY